jgi:predicted dehydrogenase
MNLAEAESMISAARENDVFLMEAFAYRCHPQTHKLVEIIQDGGIGQVRMVRAVFSFDAPYDPKSRLFAKELGGGGILDVGCYPASMTRLIAGAASGKPFLNPDEVKGSAVLGPTGVDHYAAATLKFENNVIAEIICGVACQVPSEVSVFGTDGMIHVTQPWLPSSPVRHAQSPLPPETVFPSASIHIHGQDERIREMIKIEVDRDLYTYEADTVAENINQRQAPGMTWQDSLGNMRLLDEWRREAGVVYENDVLS